MTSRVRSTSSLLVSALLVAGCGGGSGDGGAEPAGTATVTVTADPSAAAEPKQAGVMKLGQTADVGFARITALEVRPNVPVDYDQHQRWSSVLVRTCATANEVEGEPLVISWFPWTVSDQQDGVYQITGVTGGVNYPIPTYPSDPGQKVTRGQCVKGWITFNVAPGAKLRSVTYTSDSAPRPVTWRF